MDPLITLPNSTRSHAWGEGVPVTDGWYEALGHPAPHVLVEDPGRGLQLSGNALGLAESRTRERMSRTGGYVHAPTSIPYLKHARAE